MLDKLKALMIPDSWKKVLGYLLVGVAIYVANTYLGTNITPPLPDPAFKTSTPPGADHVDANGHYNFGWVKDDGAVKAVQGELRFQVFADTPAGQVADAPKEFFQWVVWKKYDPRGPPAKNQGNLGSCVSFGTNNAITRTMVCQIVMNQANEEFKDIAEEATYGGSRVEIGGGKLGRGDGSVGAWAAQFVQKYGVISREKHGNYDLSSKTSPW